MIEIPTQLRDRCPVCGETFGSYFLPYGIQAQEKSRSYKIFQVLRSKFWGVKKPRSLAQLNTYWACCGMVAELTSDHQNRWTKDDIDFEVKTKVCQKTPALIKRFKIVKGITYIELISISFENMDHLEACKYFDKAFPVMSDLIDTDHETMIQMAKDRMGG